MGGVSVPSFLRRKISMSWLWVTAWPKRKYRLAARWLVSACTMGRPGSRRKLGRHGQQKSRLLCRLRQRSSVLMEVSWTAYRRHITPRTASTKGPWSKAMKSSSIRKISAVTMSSTACGASSNYNTSTSVRPSWSSAAVFPNRSSKRSMACSFASTN